MITLTWRKSSHSGTPSGGGECVELAAMSETVCIRDSKSTGTGHLSISRDRFAALVHRIKVNSLDR